MLVTVGMQISSFRRESGVGNSLPARAEAFYLSDVSSGKGPNLAMRSGGVLRSWEGHVEGPMALDGIALVMGIGLIVLGLVLPFQPNLRRSVRVFTCWTGFNVALASAIEIFKSESLMYGISYSVTDTISWILTEQGFSPPQAAGV